MNSVIPYLQGHKVFRLTAVSTAVVNCNHLRISDVFPDEYIAFQNTILHFTQLSKGAFYSDKEITVQSTPLSWEGMHYCDLQKILPPLIFPEPWEWVTVIFTRRHSKRGDLIRAFGSVKLKLSCHHNTATCEMQSRVTCPSSGLRGPAATHVSQCFDDNDGVSSVSDSVLIIEFSLPLSFCSIPYQNCFCFVMPLGDKKYIYNLHISISHQNL